MSETRSSIILVQIARAQRKLTGNNIYKAKAEIDKISHWSLIKTACYRPLCLSHILQSNPYMADPYW